MGLTHVLERNVFGPIGAWEFMFNAASIRSMGFWHQDHLRLQGRFDIGGTRQLPPYAWMTCTSQTLRALVVLHRVRTWPAPSSAFHGQDMLRISALGTGLNSPLLRRGLVVLDSSCFRHIIDPVSHSQAAYRGDMLARVSEKRRGMCLESLARETLERLYPGSTSADACSELMCYSGKHRPRHISEWDFTLGGRRIELKSAMLCFLPRRRTWSVSFTKVKLGTIEHERQQPFDDLYLLIYTPADFYLVKHDLQTHVSTAGIRTRLQGHTISVLGQSGQISWEAALNTILDKLLLSGGCQLISRVPRSDPMVSALYRELSQSAGQLQDNLYDRIPMSTLSGSARATRIQRIALGFDQMQNADSTFATAHGEKTATGRRRGTSNAAVDWVRDGVRVEVKSSKVCFDRRSQLWYCTFSGIKESEEDSCGGTMLYFDELWLAIYSPCGLDFFKHASYRSSLVYSGACTGFTGRRMFVYASTRDTYMEAAVGRIKAKLEAAGAQPVLSLLWSN